MIMREPEDFLHYVLRMSKSDSTNKLLFYSNNIF